MGLTVLPAVGGSLGPEKVDEPGATPGLDDRLYGSEWNAAAQALQEVCEQVGLADGSTPGSIQEKLDTLSPDEISSTDGTYEGAVQTTATPGFGSALLGSADGARYSKFVASTTGSSTIASTKSVDGALETETEHTADSAAGTAGTTTTVTDGVTTTTIMGDVDASGGEAKIDVITALYEAVAQVNATASSAHAVFGSLNSTRLAGMVTDLGTNSSAYVTSQASGISATLSTAIITSLSQARLSMTATDGSDTVGIEAATNEALQLLSLGQTIPLNESGHEALPSGITSIVQGLGLLNSFKISDIGVWAPTVTPVANVTSVSVLKAGPYFVFETAGVKWCWCSCVTQVMYSAVSTTISYNLSTPVSSDFTSYLDAQGSVNGQGIVYSGHVQADAALDELVATLYVPTTGMSTGVNYRQVIQAVFEVK